MIEDRAIDRRLVVCAALSVVAHIVLAHGMRRLPKRADVPLSQVVTLRVVQPPPPEPEPEPAKPEEPRPPPPKVVHERPRAQRAQETPPTEAPKDVPPPDRPPTSADTTDTPVFGISMESTSQAGSGPAMPVGNTARPRAAAHADDAAAAEKQLAAPVPEYQVTTMPLPQGRCVGEYTDEAKRAGLEGVVVLALVVGADGRTRDIHVVSGDPRLTDSAIAALKRCRFSPGEKDGTPVPVRIREFKIRFVLDSAGE